MVKKLDQNVKQNFQNNIANYNDAICFYRTHKHKFYVKSELKNHIHKEFQII